MSLKQRLQECDEFHFGLTSGAAVSYIEQKLTEKGLLQYMTAKTRTLLADNRRAGRNANIDRYGFIPFARYGNTVRYSRELILLWIDDELLPFLYQQRAKNTKPKPTQDKKLTPILSRGEIENLTKLHFSN